MRSLPVERPDGTRFEVTLEPADAPDAPSALVVPAMGMGARWYRPLLTALSEAGVHAAVTELRGHEVGGRRAGRRYDWGYADLVADLGLAVDTMAAAGLPAPYLLGHSLGGQVASVFAARRPESVRGVMLVAAGSVHWRLFGPRFLFLTQGAAALAALVGHFPGARVGFADREARTQMRDWARFGRTGRLVVGGRDTTPELARLSRPVLAISFDGDHLGPPASVDGLVGLLAAAPVTRVHLTEPTDHLRWARTPEVVVPTLLRWLDAVG